MNRYIVIDLENLCVSYLNKVETDFEENELQTGSISCRDNYDLTRQLVYLIEDLLCIKGSVENE